VLASDLWGEWLRPPPRGGTGCGPTVTTGSAALHPWLLTSAPPGPTCCGIDQQDHRERLRIANLPLTRKGTVVGLTARSPYNEVNMSKGYQPVVKGKTAV